MIHGHMIRSRDTSWGTGSK